MRNTKRVISLTLVSILLVALAIPAFADGDSDNGNNDKVKGPKFTSEEKRTGPPEFVIKKLMDLKGFTYLDGKKIKVNKKNVEFDAGPVIKDGRTLIPVRAITEAMGAKVEYNSETSIVKITSEDGTIVIELYLDEADEGKATVNGVVVPMDVKPGVSQNRTYVPLRFIAEQLGLKVSHDDKTGNIDIDEEQPALKLTPTHISFPNDEVLTDVVVKYSMDSEYDLLSIKNGSVVLSSSDYTTSSNTITILEDYVNDLTVENTTLTFLFEDSKDVQVSKTFEIQIDLEGVYEEPTISPLGVKYFSSDEIVNKEITVDWNDHSLNKIMDGTSTLTKTTDYTVLGNKITLQKSYIDGLATGKTTLTLVFEASDKELVNLEFTIEK